MIYLIESRDMSFQTWKLMKGLNKQVKRERERELNLNNSSECGEEGVKYI